MDALGAVCRRIDRARDLFSGHLWNAQHEWASFAFQTSRRLAEAPRFALHKLLASALVLITPTGVLAVALSLRGAGPAVADGNGDAPRQRRFIAAAVLIPLAVFALFSLRHEVKLDWTGAPWTAALPLMAAGMAAAGPSLKGMRAWVRAAWMPTLVTMLLIYGAGLHYLVLGLPGLGYSKHIELIPVGWRDFSRRILDTAAGIRAETGSEPLIVGMDRYAIASELAYYGAGRTTSSAHLFGGIGLMYERWTPADLQEGRNLLLVAWDPNDLTGTAIESHAERWGPLEEEVLMRDGQVVRHYYHRVAYNYRALRIREENSMRLTTSQWLAAAVAAAACTIPPAAQTPEQQQMWDAQRAQAQADEKAKAERLAKQREARKADPMAWVRTLDPMSPGGWVFRAVGADGSWATFSTDHQLKRSGHQVTAWLRQEYPEPQRSSAGDAYVSDVERIQYDCAKVQARVLMIIYYAENNLSGSQQSEENDPKQTAWDPIVPGTQSEFIFHWACGRHQQGRDHDNSMVADNSFDRSAQGPTRISTSPGSNTGSRSGPRKRNSSARNDKLTVPVSPGRKSILANPLSSSSGRATLAILSCVNRKTVSSAARAPALRTST